MKRKDLKEYIRTEIINELSIIEKLYREKPGSDPQNKNPDIVSTQPNSSLANDSQFKSKYEPVSESDLEEMAYIVNKIKIQDPTKFALAKEVYSSGRTGALLDALSTAGEEGMTQKELGTALGLKNDSELNSVINNLRIAGVLTPKREKTVKPEKTSPEVEPELPTLTPDEEPEEETVDTYFKDDEEETPEEAPTAVSDKEVEKTVGKTYADLSPEEEALFNTYKTAIVNKVKILNDKKSSKDDKTKAKVALDSYKTKDNVKKVFTKKGLKLIDYINSELNK
jgi:hypothetical protein